MKVKTIKNKSTVDESAWITESSKQTVIRYLYEAIDILNEMGFGLEGELSTKAIKIAKMLQIEEKHE